MDLVELFIAPFYRSATKSAVPDSITDSFDAPATTFNIQTCILRLELLYNGNSTIFLSFRFDFDA